MRGATGNPISAHNFVYISILAPHEGCDCERTPLPNRELISILAPHEGCDMTIVTEKSPYSISILAPHEGCDKETGGI